VPGLVVTGAVGTGALAGAAAAGSDAAVALSDLDVEPASAFGEDSAFPPRKSVTYQPEPLSWKPAAVTCFSNAACPQAGQSLNCGSEIFCKTSLANPQELHL